jgi:hypothetical protein
MATTVNFVYWNLHLATALGLWQKKNEPMKRIKDRDRRGQANATDPNAKNPGVGWKRLGDITKLVRCAF